MEFGRKFLVVLVFALPGCYEYLETPPLLKATAFPGAAERTVKVPGPSAKPGSLRPGLPEILRLLEERNPELASLRASAAAASHDTEQADRAPNPSVSANPRFPMEGKFGAMGSATLSQKIEIGKRGPRVREARARHGVAAAAYTARRSALALEVKGAYWDILTLQEGLSLDRENRKILASLAQLTGRLLERGAETRDKLLNAEVERGKAALAVRDRERDLKARLRELEALLDLRVGILGGVKGSLGRTPALPPPEALRERLRKNNPDVRLAASRKALSQAGVDRERAKPIPDLTASVVYAREMKMDGGGGKNNVGVGLRLPLPLLDGNRAGVAASRARVREAEEAARGVLRAKLGALASRREAWEKARADAATWSDELLPRLVESASLAKKIYEGGKSSYLVLLEADRRLVEARRTVLALRLAERQAFVEIETLLGGAAK
jgi:cobalt-zinc-cadmium efflux system outer membrane protein